MSTKATSERLDDVRRRIDMLEAGAQAAGAGVRDSIKAEIDALRRQEASARAALRDEHRPITARTPDHGDPTKDKYFEIEKRLGAAEYELAAKIARGPGGDGD
jgi:hypothetical protein